MNLIPQILPVLMKIYIIYVKTKKLKVRNHQRGMDADDRWSPRDKLRLPRWRDGAAVNEQEHSEENRVVFTGATTQQKDLSIQQYLKPKMSSKTASMVIHFGFVALLIDSFFILFVLKEENNQRFLYFKFNDARRKLFTSVTKLSFCGYDDF